MFELLTSPSMLAKREILIYAAREAAAFGTTTRAVVDTFFDGNARPGLLGYLERMEAASGLPPSETMALVTGFWDPEQIEPADLLVVMEALVGPNTMPTPEQAKELVDAAQRLARRSRSYAKYAKAAQAAHDAQGAQTPIEPPPQPVPPTHRPVRAHMVERYSAVKRLR